jgi:hypothetical protein
MSWARIDDNLHSHPKAAEAGLEAVGLWTLALSHSSDHGTRGVVTLAILAKLAGGNAVAKRCIKRLVDAKMLDPHEALPATFRIHDFEEWNPDFGTARAEAGRRGAVARWGPRGPTNDGKCHGKSHPLANGKPVAKPVAMPMANTMAKNAPLPLPSEIKIGSPSYPGSLPARETEPESPKGLAASPSQESHVSLTDAAVESLISGEPESESMPVAPPVAPVVPFASRLAPSFDATAVEAERAKQLAALRELEELS